MNLNKPNENMDMSLLDEYQRSIFNGLNEVGEEISTLYYDGVKIFRSNFSSKPYLLAHIAREIEGGIRDIFASGKKSEVQKCSQCDATRKQNSHIDEICKILGVDTNDEFANEWHKIARDFHKYAHRQGSWKTTREKEAFDDLWKQFERKVLHRLVGNYLNLLTLVDQVLTYDQPTKEILETLSNLLQNEIRRRYFFNKLTFVQWFSLLFERGYFKPEEAPSPKPADQEGYFTIPQWNVLPYLEKVSQQVTIPGNEKYIDDLLAIIKDVSNYRDSNEQHIDNYRTWYYFVKILCNIPPDKIPIDIIDLIPIWLDSKFDADLQGSEIATKLLPKFLPEKPTPEDIKKAERIVDYITAFKTVPLSEERAKLLGEQKEARLVIDSYWLEEAFKKYSETIGEKCTAKVVEDLTKKIKSLLKSEEDETYYSFYDEREHHITEPMEMLTFILKRVLLAKAKRDVTTARITLKQFIEDKYFYFSKMALYVMGQNMDKYNDLCWEILKSEKGDLLMEKTLYFGDELKHLLKNLKNLTDEQRKMLDTKIENAAKRLDFKEESEKYIALHKQEIYEALSHDSYFKNLYEEMKKITEWDVALHPAIGKVETRWGPGPSPFTKEEIIKMPNDKLAEFLRTFKTKDSWRGPTVGGLADALKESAVEWPEKFINDFSPFLQTSYYYVYEILFGINDAWNNKKAINWEKLLNFIERYINRPEFWQDKFIITDDDWKATHRWVVGIVSELIQEGTRDDSWAFPEKLFEKAEKIIFLILDRLEPEDDKEITDYVTYTLNTPHGKTLTALILLALRIARVNAQRGVTEEVKWTDKYRGKFEDILNKRYKEGFVNLGRYLPNLYYLDKEWVKEKIKSLEDEKGTKYWEAFIDGYLSIGMVYDELYGLMRPHYQYGVEYDFKEKRDNEHLIQHISLAYLKGQESIEKPDSLFKQIIDKFKYSKIREIIGFFWMQREYLTESSDENEKIKTRILEFWKLLYDKYKGKQSFEEEDEKILSSASKLAAILPRIDSENFEWLKLSAPYVHVNFKSSFFIEYLDKLKDKGDNVEVAKYIGEIFLKMLEKFTPDYDQKHIRSIVEFLYDAGAMDSANKICNIYGSRGYEFLRDIYEKHPSRT